MLVAHIPLFWMSGVWSGGVGLEVVRWRGGVGVGNCGGDICGLVSSDGVCGPGAGGLAVNRVVDLCRDSFVR